jgi:hypothetical protein
MQVFVKWVISSQAQRILLVPIIKEMLRCNPCEGSTTKWFSGALSDMHLKI